MSIKSIIAPSVLAADFGNLEREIKMINESQADWIHVDIMDGVFVPNISMGLPVMEAIARHAKKPLDVHLMIVQPERYVEAFHKAGASTISIHVEACNHLQRNIQQIKSLGCKAGVVLNPHTPVVMLENIISEVDLVCVMSVNPGFGAQKFIENTYRKIAKVKEMIVASNSNALIQVDGGVSLENANRLYASGANIFVAGNLIFSSSDPHGTIVKLKASII